MRPVFLNSHNHSIICIIAFSDAHDGRITSLSFLPREPLLVSSGSDNALRMWLFDRLDGGGRLFKSRDGHRAPPTSISYYGAGDGIDASLMHDGADGRACQILSAGLVGVRVRSPP